MHGSEFTGKSGNDFPAFDEVVDEFCAVGQIRADKRIQKHEPDIRQFFAGPGEQFPVKTGVARYFDSVVGR